MLRTIFMIGLFAIGGLFLLKLTFGILVGFFGLLIWLVKSAIFIALVGAVLYLLIRIFSPGTAQRLRERWSGSGM
ncbi:MAG TPA: hypothetical protein VFD64_15015 [Gemmatimonadaceae bacterium]|jgi:hypothetical protein|nr:hypothetical protein [Gemmatimonadaceae bacterium]